MIGVWDKHTHTHTHIYIYPLFSNTYSYPNNEEINEKDASTTTLKWNLFSHTLTDIEEYLSDVTAFFGSGSIYVV